MDINFQVVPRHEVDRSEWDRFVDQSPQGWFFHRGAYLDALATWRDREDRSLALVERSTGLIGVLPLMAVSQRRARVLSYRMAESQGGPAVRAGLAPRVDRRVRQGLIAAAVDVAAQVHAAELIVSLAPLAPSWRPGATPAVNPLDELGLRDAGGSCWVVDLRAGADSLWRGVEGRVRTEVRKAERAGLTVRLGGPADLEAYYALHCATYRRTGVQPHPRAYFEAVFGGVLDAGLNRVWVAEHDAVPVAAANFAWYKDAAWYWTGAADDRALALGANALLQWTAMRQMADSGLSFYEAGPAHLDARDGKQYRLSEFKRAFGGVLHPAYSARLVTRPLLRHVLATPGVLREALRGRAPAA